MQRQVEDDVRTQLEDLLEAVGGDHPDRVDATGQPAWPRLTGTGGPTLQLNPTEIRTVDLAAEHNCAFWTTMPS